MTAEDTLLNPPSRVEDDRRAYIRQWLVSLGIPEMSIRAEYHTESGPADLYLTNRRVMIEVKSGGKLKNGPYDSRTGSPPGVSAFEQLDRYVRDERRRGQRYIDEEVDNYDQPWIGIVTDAQVWWMWWWNPRHDRNMHDDAQKNPRWQGRKLDRTNVGDLAGMLKREPIGKEWATSDMSSEFEPVRIDLIELYARRQTLRATGTQKGLWLEQLRASGSAPESDMDEIFVLHTMLILIARMIASGKDYDQSKITEGFVQWADLSQVPSLSETVGKYDWRQEGGDILRAIYEYFIPEQHRKIYGEYYTPDWLAEIMCAKVIDDGFIEEQIKAYNSGKEPLRVLDPTCGSGTFLHHAARRILDSRPVQDSGMEDAETIRFVCSVVSGIDIHPVAVEMARANMNRLFPSAPDSDIMVYQGDSLLTPRAMDSFYAAQSISETVPLRSPRNNMLLMPIWFAKSPNDMSKFVNTARDGKPLPPNLGGGLKGYNKRQLLDAHKQMSKIIREEGNGVWKWYIMNQAGPNNLKGTAGRIVSNPPWVQLNKIRVTERKNEIRGMAKAYGLWIGGSTATTFDEAALFVDRCTDLYFAKSEKRVSGWVLPHGSIDSGAWVNFRRKLADRISGVWNLGRLPFPKTPSCVTFFGVRIPTKVLRKKKGVKLNHDDPWKIVESKIHLEEPCVFVDNVSEWMNGRKNNKPLARQGATLDPHCLLWIREMQRSGKDVRIATRASMHPPWSELGSLEGVIPDRWIRDCITADDMVPYLLYKTTKCVIPLDGDGWDEERRKNKFWQDATDYYGEHRGRGESTAKTLEDQLNHNNKLFTQFGFPANQIVYNKSGDRLYAARRTHRNHIHYSNTYAVPCKTKNEAYFLASILNAGCMLEAFQWTRKSDRDFHQHFWRKIPIPRYDNKNKAHQRLAVLGKKAEDLARSECMSNPTLSTKRLQSRIRLNLQESGIASEIDECCRELFPDHAHGGK